MKLTKYQKKALSDFEEFGYLVIEAPRGSGKSILLREIIRRNIDKEVIGVVCRSQFVYKIIYGAEFDKKTTYIPYKKFLSRIVDLRFTLIIGDEVLVAPQRNTKTACALTQDYFIHHWNLKDIPFMTNSRIKTMREVLSKEMFRTLTGISI